jgi:hypothetical protein
MIAPAAGMRFNSRMLLSIAALTAPAAEMPSYSVRTMIRDARQIVERSGDEVWPGFSGVPMPVQLVEAKREVLFCAPAAPGFIPISGDRVTGCGLQVRRRELPVDISAANYLGEFLVIQLGLPSALEASRPEWIVTLLHEAFHQFQASLVGYQDAVDTVAKTLGQSGSDWMLNYHFPYADPGVAAAFNDMNRCALAYLSNRSTDETGKLVADYVRARRKARAIVGEKDWRYFEFQVGQEGVARWSELKLAGIAGRRDERIAITAQDRWAGLATSLRAMNDQGLGIWKRSTFYVLGAVEADMLEQVAPGWKRRYARAPFSIGEQLDAAMSPGA